MGRHSADGPSAASGEHPSRRDAFGDYETGEQDIIVPSASPALRRRVAIAVGIALLGVVLLVFGLVSLLSTDDDPQTATGQTTSSAAQTTAVPSVTTAETTPPVATTAPPAPAPAFLPVTVLNASPDLTAGLATRVAAELEAGGWPIVQLLNYDRSRLDVTTAFFTPGHAAEESAAQALVVQFPEISGGAVPRFDGLAGTGLTVAAVGDWLP